MDKIEELENQKIEIQKQINEIERIDFIKTQEPFLKSLKGKYFVYRNNTAS